MMRVMVVDDERFFRELYSDYLGKGLSCVVETYEIVDHALARFDQGGIDLVITDLVMPGIDGLAFVAALRDREPELPIVVVTQREDVRPAIEALRLGVNDYLVKPVEGEVLVLAAQRALKGYRQRQEARRLNEAQTESLRTETVYRRCLELLGLLDVDHLEAEVPAALAQLCGGQGAALWHGGPESRDPFRLRAFSGLVDRSSVPMSFRLDTGGVTAGRLQDLAAHIEGGALYVPVVAEGRLFGVAMVVDKVSGAFTEEDAAAARIVGDFAGIALANALRVSHYQRAGLRDRETAAYNITYFIDYADKEIYKAKRYGRTFSLISLQLDNLQVLRRALSAETTRKVYKALIGAIQRVIRDSDILAKVTEDTFYLLLPETDYFGALMFTRRALSAFEEDPLVAELTVPPSISVGAAGFPKDGGDFEALVQSCKRNQEEVRRSPLRRLHLHDRGFWEIVETMLNLGESVESGGVTGAAEAGLAEPLFAALQREVARDLLRDPGARGLVYLGAQEVGPDDGLVSELDPGREAAARLYFLGNRVAGGLDHPTVTCVELPDERRLHSRRFLLYLCERSAYAWIEDTASGRVHHSSDPPLVEALVARLQEHYELQRPY